MSDDRFNGWTNRETWLMHLHLTNTQPIYLECRSLALAAPNDLAAGEAICEWVDEWLGDHITETKAPLATDAINLLTDIVRQTLIRANWTEIGKAFREE